MTTLLNYNSTTGALTMPNPGSELAAGWTWDTIDITTKGVTQQRSGVKWQTTGMNEDQTDRKASFTFYATGNVDPYMNYAFSAKNNTLTTQTYSFVYGEVLSPPVSGGYSLYADVGGSITNASGTGTAKINPVFGDFDGDGVAEIQTLHLSTDLAASFVSAGADVGEAFETTSAPGTTTYVVDSHFIPAGTAIVPFNYWEIRTSFTLSPKDSVALSGFVELIPDSEANVPEPSTYALIVGGLSLAAVAWKRRSRA